VRQSPIPEISDDEYTRLKNFETEFKQLKSQVTPLQDQVTPLATWALLMLGMTLASPMQNFR
jgi:hypothetical protein